MKKNLMFVCIALIVVMSLIVSCDNSSKNPDAGKFTVTFDTDGGSVIKPVKIGLFQTVAEPEKPTKEDYAFDGWYLGDEKYDFSKPVISNITLVAKWNLIFKASTNLLNEITSTITGTSGAYDRLQAGTYKVEDVVTPVEDFKYYVCVGTTPLDSIENIKLGNSTFTKDQEVYISMGNNAFIKDKVFYVEDNNLYIAAPILAVELTEKNSFMINNISCNLGLSDPSISEPESTTVRWKSGSANQIERLDDGSYLSTINEASINWLEFDFGLEESTSFLTKKTKIKITGETDISYGYTEADTSSYDSSKKVLAFYPQPHGSEGVTYKTIEYSVYFNVKAKHIKLDFKTE